MRGRNRRGPNPLTRSFESNGPDVKVRGTAQHIAEKYTQLARDAHVSGDPVAAESYLQHAEHYYRIIAAAHQAQQAQQNGVANGDERDDGDDDDFDTANDRFTFRSPQAVQQQQNGQPYQTDRPQPEFGEGGEERAEGEDAQPERLPQQDRPQEGRHPMRHHRDDRRGGRGPDRNFRPRNEGGFQDRGQGERSFQGERGFQDRGGQDRGGQERFQQGFRPRRPQQEFDPAGEQPAMPALPAFLTAPTRPLPAQAEGGAPEESAPAAEGDEASRSQFRNRRRRRGRGGREEGEGGAPEPAVSGDEVA